MNRLVFRISRSHRSGDMKSHRSRLLHLVSEFNDGEKRLEGNAAPIQAETSPDVRFNDTHTRPKLRRSDRRDIPPRPGTKNSDMRLTWHDRHVSRDHKSEARDRSRAFRNADSPFLLAGKKLVVLRRRHQ
jgi:hypothetical protein